MGEAAEAIINGLFCESCGALIDGDEPGYPRKCSDCKSGSFGTKPKKRRGRGSQFVKVTLDEFNQVLRSDKGWYLCDMPNVHEHIFGWRPKSQPAIEIKVATTVNKDTQHHRRYGKDAIRVWAIWCPEGKKSTHGLVKSKSVKRTDGWQKRLEARVLEVLQLAKANAAVIGTK